MLKIHSTPPEHPKSSLFTVKINGRPVLPELARVSAMPFNTPWPGHQRPLDQTEEAAFISFEGDAPAEISVRPVAEVKKAVVRPLSKKVSTTLCEGEIKFTLQTIGSYVLEVNGQHCPLHLFFNPPRDFKAEAEAEAAQGRRVYYYGPGIHKIGNVSLPSHSTVTIDGGAVVMGSFSAFRREDVKINGYGILDGSLEKRTNDTPSGYYMPEGGPTHFDDISTAEEFDTLCREQNFLNGMLRFYFCKDVLCEGITLRDSSIFCIVPAVCDGVVIDRIKTIGMWRYNCDGIDIFNSRNVTVKNCFLRNFDDAMVIKGMMCWDRHNNENITVDGCVIWCDWGSACEIGAETNADEYKNILYKNCDLLHDTFGAMMRVHHHNRAEIHSLRYENMHCEFCADQMAPLLQASDDMVYTPAPDSYQPYILSAFVSPDMLYGRDGLQGVIHDLHFEDIYLHIDPDVKIMPQIYLAGRNEKTTVHDIFLKGFYVNGKRVQSLDELPLCANEFVYNVFFE